MSLLVGCPVILPPRDDVVASWTHQPHVLIINGSEDAWQQRWRPKVDHAVVTALSDLEPDGSVKNLGVAASWNRIFLIAQRRSLSHVALISQGVVLKGGTAHLAGLMDEYADQRGLLTDFAWHCIVLSVALWEQLGPFDEQFWPGFYEDSDYLRRMLLAGVHTPENRMPKVGRDLLDGTETFGATLESGAINASCYGANGQRFRNKWGGDPFRERWTVPYDPSSFDPTNNWSTAEGGHLGQPTTEGAADAER